MVEDSLKSKEDWKGALASQFEEDIQLPKDENWKAIEHVIFAQKKVRLIRPLIIISTLLISGLGIFFFQKSPNPYKKIKSKNAVQNNPIDANISDKNLNSNSHHKVILTEKNEHSNRVNQTLSSGNKFKLFDTINSKKSESAQIKNQIHVSISKSDKFGKTRMYENDKQHQNINPISRDKINLSTEISGYKNQDSSKPIKSVNESSSLGESTQKLSENVRNLDTTLRLTSLPKELLSIARMPQNLELMKNDSPEFKPYFSVQFAPFIGRNIRTASGTFNSGSNYSNAVGDRRVSLPKFGFQTTINYHIKKRLSLNTGFQLAGGNFQSRWFFKYLQIEPTTNDIRLKTTSGEASTSDPILLQSITNGTAGIYKIRLNHAFLLYSIPVGITYRFTDERFSPYFRTGLNMEFFGWRALSIDVLENGITRNIELDLNGPNNLLNLQGILAFGIESRIKDRWSCFAEAGYYVPLNPFVNSNGYSVRIAGSSILGGVRYEFKKQKSV
jgi:hypothetical protein